MLLEHLGRLMKSIANRRDCAQRIQETVKDLPPAMVQTAGNDVLRDEGEAYARKLDEVGVDRSILLVAAELSVELLYDL